MHYMLCIVFYALCSMHCIICFALYAYYDIHCTLFFVVYALYSMHSILSIVFFKLYSMHCILCIDFFAVYSMQFYSMQGILWIELYELYCNQCIICIVFYAMYSMPCILCIVFYASYSMHCILCSVCILCIVYLSWRSITNFETRWWETDRPTDWPPDRQTLSYIELLLQLKITISTKVGQYASMNDCIYVVPYYLINLLGWFLYPLPLNQQTNRPTWIGIDVSCRSIKSMFFFKNQHGQLIQGWV